MSGGFSKEDVEVIEKSTPFQGYFRVDRYKFRHRLHAGGWSPPLVREVFERGHAVGVLLYDAERDVVGLIEQFRPGAYAAGWYPWMIEVVAGIIEDDQPPAIAAVREVQEEAGVTVTDLAYICRYLVSPGGTSESIHLYCAKVDSQALGGLHGLKEEDEDIRVLAVPTEQALAWLNEDKLLNAVTILALQWLALHRDSLRARWTT